MRHSRIAHRARCAERTHSAPLSTSPRFLKPAAGILNRHGQPEQAKDSNCIGCFQRLPGTFEVAPPLTADVGAEHMSISRWGVVSVVILHLLQSHSPMIHQVYR